MEFFQRMVADSVQNNNYDKGVAYKEALYRSANAKRKGNNKFFTYYHLVTPAQGQEGFNNASNIIKDLPREFTIHPGENSIDWFTQDSENPNNIGPHERIKRRNILKRSREKSKGDRGRGGTFTKVYGGYFKGEHAEQHSLLALKNGSQDPHSAMLFHGLLSREKSLHDTHSGIINDVREEKRLKNLYAQSRSKSMYVHDTPQAGVQVTHPPFVGSVSIDKQLDDLGLALD